MKRKITILSALALGVAGIGGASLAYAGSSATGERAESQEQDEQQEAKVLAGARISLAQAVQSAETRTGMKASEAGVDDESGKPYFEVSVGHGQQEQTVLIDTQTGQVASIATDAEEGEDKDD